MASLNQDRSANRVALCSAIFAGFAYVGYAVVRTAFGGRKINNGFFRNEEDCLGLEYDDGKKGRVFMRRLSGSSIKTQRTGRRELKAAAACVTQRLENGDNEEAESVTGIHCVLRPLSVRERLRELNLDAMRFADTLLILNGKKPLGPRSLGSSPFHSPTRIMSPLDINRQFLMYDDPNIPDDPSTPRLSRRSSRRNLSRRSLANSVVNLSEEQQGEAVAVAQTLLTEREAELTRRLDSFASSRPRELTPYEGKSLVALLHSQDKEKISRTLVTISNCAAFTRNQDLMREAGLLVLLPSLLADCDRAVSMAAVKAASNLALNTGNMKEMEQAVLVLALMVEDQTRLTTDPEMFTQILLSLTNLAVLPDWHHHLHHLLPGLLGLVVNTPASDRSAEAVKYQSSRLLVNLSCNDENIPHLLSAKCQLSASAANLVSRSVSEDQLLRNVTLLANLSCSALRLGLVDWSSAGDEDSPSFLTDLLQTRGRLVQECHWLMENHKNSDIRMQVRKITVAMSKTEPA